MQSFLGAFSWIGAFVFPAITLTISWHKMASDDILEWGGDKFKRYGIINFSLKSTVYELDCLHC